jgi:hypothetical protein
MDIFFGQQEAYTLNVIFFTVNTVRYLYILETISDLNLSVQEPESSPELLYYKVRVQKAPLETVFFFGRGPAEP